MSDDLVICPLFSEGDYARILEVVNNPDAFPPTYREFEMLVEQVKSESAREGRNFRPAVVDAQDFITSCNILRVAVNFENAILYVVSRDGVKPFPS